MLKIVKYKEFQLQLPPPVPPVLPCDITTLWGQQGPLCYEGAGAYL